MGSITDAELRRVSSRILSRGVVSRVASARVLLAMLLPVSFARAAEPAPAAKIDPSKLEVFDDGELFGYRTADGKVVIAPHYLSAGPFSPEGLACVVAGGQTGWSWIRSDQRVVARAFNFDNGCDPFSEEKPHLARFLAVDAAGVEKLGFIHSNGDVAIPAQFDGAFPFQHGKAVICIGCRLEPLDGDVEHRRWVGGRWGEVDVKGKVKVEPAPRTPAPTANATPKR